ncbi:MAG: DUF169 domain-containing protein [bacterium]
MESKIARSIRMKYNPVALLWSDEEPPKCVRFQKGKWGCVMWLVAAAAKGRTAACSRDTFGCFGGGVGLGFGNQYQNFPGGEECFCRFLSIGNQTWEEGRQMAEKVKPFMREEAYEEFLKGERYMKSPEQVHAFIECLPLVDIPAPYVVFKPLHEVGPAREKIETVIFFVDPDQLSALVVLANYGRGDNENVIVPYAAGCQTIGIYPYREAKSAQPRAVVGLTDLSARLYIRQQLDANLMSFAVPLSLFEEMERNVEGSFLERPTWAALLEGKEKIP